MASIELQDVSLVYPIYGTNSRSLKSSMIHFATGGRLNREHSIVQVEALKNINFSLKSGDRLGLIGHNGAGKTTLLKVLAQIYEPTKGKVCVSGEAHCLFDIMVGMDFSLTGYENILLRGFLLGLSKKEVENAIPKIEEFAELGDFIKMPLKSYSSGMLVRLAFGIITSVPTQILLVDEVVNVGDSRFVQKAKARMSSLVHQSDILVLSTHDMGIIKEFCTMAARLEHGEVVAFGKIEEVL